MPEGPSLGRFDLGAIVESIPHMVWTARPDGFVDYLNGSSRERTGMGPDERCGWEWVQLVHPEDAPRAQASWHRATANAAPYEVDYRLRRADGTYGWVTARAMRLSDENGVGIRWVGTWTDADRFMPASRTPRPGTRTLSKRELEILQLAADGASGPRIADALIISPATVKTHFENIYEKLQLGDRTAAVAYALRAGLIT
jgi:PAS domain S-box-containing protein